MSTLKVDNIRDNGSGFNDVVSFQNVNGTENGKLCRAFVNFNGQGAVAIRGNFNVNSITDNGTGDFVVNLSNALSDANYASIITVSDNGATANFGMVQRFVRSSSTCGFNVYATTLATQDVEFNYVAFFR